MSDAAILLAKGLAGGVLVVTFACLSQGLRPKRFAGLFSAAPAVAIAGLSITLLDPGAHDAHEGAMGMLSTEPCQGGSRLLTGQSCGTSVRVIWATGSSPEP